MYNVTRKQNLQKEKDNLQNLKPNKLFEEIQPPDHMEDNNNEEEELNDNELDNYKGIYFNDDNDEKYYEGGAHFRYHDLCKILEKTIKDLSPERRGKTLYEDVDVNEDGNGNYNNTTSNRKNVFGDNSINSKVISTVNSPEMKLNKQILISNYDSTSISKTKEESKEKINEGSGGVKVINMNTNNFKIFGSATKDFKGLREKTKTLRNLNINVHGNGNTGVNNALASSHQNLIAAFGNSSAKNANKKENAFIIKEIESTGGGGLIKNEIAQGFGFYKKVKPGMKKNSTSTHTNTNMHMNSYARAHQPVKNPQKVLNFNHAEKKGHHNTKIQKSKLNMNSTIKASNVNLNGNFLNSSNVLNKYQANSTNLNIPFSSALSKPSSAIISDNLSKITSISKSRNISKTKNNNDNNSNINLINNALINTNINNTNTNHIHIQHENLIQTNIVHNNNKLTYSDTKAIGNGGLNNYNLTPTIQISSNVELNVTMKNVSNNGNTNNFHKSRNTNRNLPDKTEISKNHTTTDNKSGTYANINDSMINKFLSSTLKNDSTGAAAKNKENLQKGIIAGGNKTKSSEKKMVSKPKIGNEVSKDIHTGALYNEKNTFKSSIVATANNNSGTKMSMNMNMNMKPQFLIKNTTLLSANNKKPLSVNTNNNNNNNNNPLIVSTIVPSTSTSTSQPPIPISQNVSPGIPLSQGSANNSGGSKKVLINCKLFINIY
jgi:hypothetical protein